MSLDINLGFWDGGALIIGIIILIWGLFYALNMGLLIAGSWVIAIVLVTLVVIIILKNIIRYLT